MHFRAENFDPAEPALDRAVAAAAVAGVAGGRAKQRKLARELAGRPAALADGRSPAPRVTGDLLTIRAG